MGWVVSITPLPRFIPGERTPGTSLVGIWVGPRAGLDTEAGGKILLPLPGIEPRTMPQSLMLHSKDNVIGIRASGNCTHWCWVKRVIGNLLFMLQIENILRKVCVISNSEKCFLYCSLACSLFCEVATTNVRAHKFLTRRVQGGYMFELIQPYAIWMPLAEACVDGISV
jgi:hypothetical protein